MNTAHPTPGRPDTRWSLVGKALFDPANGVVETFQGSMRFGIAFLTSAGGVCPLVTEVPAATDNYQALAAVRSRRLPRLVF